MTFTSINPADGATLEVIAAWSERELEGALQRTADAAPDWAGRPLAERAALLRALGDRLLEQKEDLATVITLEMGKLIREARAEIEKCDWVCRYYAEHGPGALADEVIPTEAGKSYISYAPLGTVLAILPWNFPFWQTLRAAVPILLAGNTVLLKLASNVPRCALAIEQTFIDAGFARGVVQSLMISGAETDKVIADRRVHAVTVTGSVNTGRRVAARAGDSLKKTVLELGGSDPFVVLDDADLEEAARQAVKARFANAGQSCIAAKRFVVVESIAAEFVQLFKRKVERLTPGNPLEYGTTLAPMARHELRTELHRQVTDSLAQGASAVTGCAPLPGPGAFYAPSILDHVTPTTRAYHEELFGPVASIIRAQDEQDAVRIANDTVFGLGASVWTRSTERGERLARKLRCGMAFVNAIVGSDPRLPFGGIKASGYGRELSHHGLREFVNVKTVWMK